MNSKSGIPYNVLAAPVYDVVFGSIQDTIDELKEAWELMTSKGNETLWNSTKDNAITALTQGDYLAVVKAAITFLGMGANLAIPGIGAAVPFITGFIGLIWPSKSQPNVFEMMKGAIQDLIDQSITEYMLNQLDSDIDGMQTNAASFSKEINRVLSLTNQTQDSVATPPSPEGYDSVWTKFTSVSDNMALTIPDFWKLAQNSDTETQRQRTIASLPLFTIAATIHLMVYQGMIQFANRWIKYSANQQEAQSKIDDASFDLRDKIQTYSQRAYKMFTDTMPPNVSADEVRKDKINTLNRHITTLTISSLDIVSLWPTFDSKDYGMASSIEQTRYLFSDIVGPVEDPGLAALSVQTLDIDGNKVNGTPFTYPNMEVTKLALHERYFHPHSQPISGTNADKHFIDGIKLDTTNIDGQQKEYSYGNTQSKHTSQNDWYDYATPFIAPFTVINQVSSRSKYQDFGLVQFDGNRSVGASGGTTYHSTNDSLSKQKINYIYPVVPKTPQEIHYGNDKDNIDQTQIGFVAAHVPFDLQPTNIVGELDSKTNQPMIKGIPVEKTNDTNGKIMKEYITGTSVLNLSQSQHVTIPFNVQTSKKYQLRYRVATQTSGKLSFRIVDSANNEKFSVSIDVENTSDSTTDNIQITGQQGTYILYPVSNDLVQLDQGNGYKLTIQNTGNGEIVLDRIEFVPPPPPEPDNSPFSDPISQVYSFDSEPEQIIWSSDTRYATEYNLTVYNPVPQNLTISMYKDNKLVDTDSNNSGVFMSSKSGTSFNKLTITGSTRIARSCSAQGTVSRTNTELE